MISQSITILSSSDAASCTKYSWFRLFLFYLCAGRPCVTKLTIDKESRTLNCTSTGGPVTTVTWTKDGAVITPNTTHQQTQTIVDTVKGIYQSTLTIAQSVTGENLYGLYSCMVGNSRGSSERRDRYSGKNIRSLWQCLNSKLYHVLVAEPVKCSRLGSCDISIVRLGSCSVFSPPVCNVRWLSCFWSWGPPTCKSISI